MIKRLFLQCFLLMLFVVSAIAQRGYEGDQRAITAGAMSDSITQIREELADTVARVAGDSLLEVHSLIDSLHWIPGDSGAVVPVGRAAILDSLGMIDTASYDNPYLNRVLIGMGTGIDSSVATSGIVAATGVSKIGVMYYLLTNGYLTATYPLGSSVWVVKMGRCVATGYIDLDPQPAKGRF